ncbi:MAG TPA: VOC family protein [Bauldia sp.]|nr:VOC family protein [Bauldia sp.]
MTDTMTAEAPKALVPAATRLGPVHIAVTDAERALAVWRDMVGLTVIERNAGQISLGAGGRTLVVLEPNAAMPAVQNRTGLYHVAIHVPKRRDLAVAVARLFKNRFRNSPTDHLVTETTYLWDLDGNGIELTFETPERGTLHSDGDMFYGIDRNGRRHSGREAVDLDSLFAELKEGDDLGEPMPAGTRIGHVHVHVADLDAAMRFYSEAIGFRRLMLNRRFRMGDVTLDYPPHIVAFNTWAGEGALPPPANAAGLRWFTIELPSAGELAAARARLAAAGAQVAAVDGGGIETADPSGNKVRLVVA